MTTKTINGLDLVHKIIMWFAMVMLIGIVGYFAESTKSHSQTNAIQNERIGVLETEYKNINTNLAVIITKQDETNKMLNQHLQGGRK